MGNYSQIFNAKFLLWILGVGDDMPKRALDIQTELRLFYDSC